MKFSRVRDKVQIPELCAKIGPLTAYTYTVVLL